MRSAANVKRGFPLSVATALLLCAISGLALGHFARGMSGSSHATLPTKASTHTSAAATATTRAPTATNTIPATALPSTPFTLTLAVSPRSASPGQALLITVTARNVADSAPVSGLPCTLRAPRDGAPPLLQTWPAPVATAADGTANWQVSAPTAPGRYEVEVYAQGRHGLYYMYDTSVVVTG